MKEGRKSKSKWQKSNGKSEDAELKMPSGNAEGKVVSVLSICHLPFAICLLIFCLGLFNGSSLDGFTIRSSSSAIENPPMLILLAMAKDCI